MKVDFKSENHHPLSLKAFLTQQGISHRMYADLKRQSHPLEINGKRVDPDGTVNFGDLVSVHFPSEPSDPRIITSFQPIKVIYEDDNWLVVNKEAGLTSVPGPSNQDDTLVNRIKGHLVKEKAANLKPHIITRLDRFTSGVVLVAKNRLANSYANMELNQHQIDKRYLALVVGKMDHKHGMIDQPIGRIGDEFARQVTPNGQSAQTEYWVKEEFSGYSLLEIKLHTGRTHQIRVHMTSINHRLLGDQLYQGPMDQGITRQALHASFISFFDPFQKQQLNFKAKVPEDMQGLISKN